jgi:tripartite-type tricarboxylate transporter receptor subunit TctC
MNVERLFACCLQLVACSLWLVIGGAHAADYPARPIRILVPFTPGGSTDILARMIGQKLTDAWGQQVLVEQRPGAGGIIAAESVAKSAPDGYTLLLSTGTYTTIPSLYSKVPYDFVKDLQPVTLLATLPFLLVAHPSLPAKNVQELVQLARAAGEAELRLFGQRHHGSPRRRDAEEHGENQHRPCSV